MFASHHWPRWGDDDVLGFLRKQRDLYRWMHDQTMRQANHGHTPLEIAEMLDAARRSTAPRAHTTGYYGHLAHNVKAVYQRYLSWYDGNPANLWKLPPTEAGRRYVELAGGADALLAAARTAFDEGDYRWVAEVVNHLVFADPANTEAPRAAGRRVRAARLPERVGDVPQRVPDRRPGAAQRPPRPQPGDATRLPRRDDDRPVDGRDRRATAWRRMSAASMS